MSATLTIVRLNAALKGTGHPILRDLSLEVEEGEVHGLIGMSGAGKSMVAKAVLGLLPSAVRVVSGSVCFLGRELVGLPTSVVREILASGIALIPQDPFTALNPTRRIESQMTDVMRTRLGLNAKAARARALGVLDEVRIREPDHVLRRYPHELSGGQRQRVLIAIAFACNPKLIIADEPTTALDVTVQKRILRLIHELRASHKTSILFVTHDLGVVAKLCDRLTVMHAGGVIESGHVAEVLGVPRHPFTRALLAATPRYDRPATELQPVPESVLRLAAQSAVS
jgi:peptide/nickel transport system ATP-binding protein